MLYVCIYLYTCVWVCGFGIPNGRLPGQSVRQSQSLDHSIVVPSAISASATPHEKRTTTRHTRTTRHVHTLMSPPHPHTHTRTSQPPQQKQTNPHPTTTTTGALQVRAGRVEPLFPPRDGGGGAQRQLGRHRRPRVGQARAAGAGAVPRSVCWSLFFLSLCMCLCVWMGGWVEVPNVNWDVSCSSFIAAPCLCVDGWVGGWVGVDVCGCHSWRRCSRCLPLSVCPWL
jgi:hypothetical protein